MNAIFYKKKSGYIQIIVIVDKLIITSTRSI